MVFSSFRWFPFVIVLIAVVSPASGQGRSKPSARQECSVFVREAPKPARPEMALRKAQEDSLHAAIDSVLAGRDVGKGYLILHVDQISGGRSVEAMDLELGEALLDSLALRMAIHANRTGRSAVVSFPRQPASVGTDSIGSTYEWCSPRLNNMYLITRYLGREARKLPPAVLEAGAEAVIWVFVSDQGKALTSAIQRSSGFPAFDRTAISAARNARYDPAFENGIPLGVWVELPIQIRGSQ